MVSELVLCGHCHDEQKPLTETNAVSILNWFQRDRDGNPACNARVHRECADAWMEANGGSRVVEAECDYETQV
jgi:hypothetical protein